MQSRDNLNPPPTDSTRSPQPARPTGINPELILPLRLFLGGMFLYAGIQKLTAANFFNKDGSGSIGEQLHGYVADGSPLSFLIRHIALPNAVLIGVLVALAELWIGLSTLTGLLPRIGAAGGAAMSLLFFLTASWSIRPVFLGPDLPYMAAWITLYLTGP
ncbi:MAG TPA: TQO small subunit DoxD, partial [Thermomicrobiales bacterium]|nr:TQO small subunit DoxD [Thermomicrobiales bacterium]